MDREVIQRMILSEEQITELHSRLKLTTVPNWKSLPGMSSQISALKTLLSDVFIRKHNETFLKYICIIRSTLLLGPGGCCKHLLLDYCLHALEEEHSSTKPSILIISLFPRYLLTGRVYSHQFGWRLYWQRRRCLSRDCSAVNGSDGAKWGFLTPMIVGKRMRNAQFKNMEFLELVSSRNKNHA